MTQDLLIGHDIESSLRKVPEDILLGCEEIAKRIIAKYNENLDLDKQENLDLIVRPLAATLAVNELALRTIFSESTLEGIVSSTEISKELKKAMLLNFAKLNNINVASNDIEAIYSEIDFALRDKGGDIAFKIQSAIKDIDTLLRIFIATSLSPEMTRDKISYIQLPSTEVMDFTRSEFNLATTSNPAFSRADVENYQHFKESTPFKIPGYLDIYFSTAIIEEEMSIAPNTSLTLPSAYYASIDVLEDAFYSITMIDEAKEGLILQSPTITTSSEQITVKIKKYTNPELDTYILEDRIPSGYNVLYKGMYPLFLDFVLLTKDNQNIDTLTLKGAIDEYLASISRAMIEVSPSALHSFLQREYGINGVIKSTISAKLQLTAKDSVSLDVSFPITQKDLSIPVAFNSANYSNRTIACFVGEVNFETE